MNLSKNTNTLARGIKRSGLRLFIFTSAWVGSTALLTFGPRLLWEYNVPVTVGAITLNVLAGVMMLFAFFRHLKTMDELQRQTHLEAMALTLGVTMIFTVIYGSLTTVQLLPETRPANILFVTGITYIVSVSRLWAGRTSE